MDLIKTLLVYMMLVVGSATEAAPAITPPAAQPAATDFSFVTMAPIVYPTMVPTWAPTWAPTAIPTAVPTPVPTATPTVYTTLYVGDRGEEVRKLQRRLAELKYLTDKIDGVYGQNTKRAVERFQYYNNLTVDGIAGKATQRVLFESRNVVTAPPDITPAPTATTPPMVSVTVPVYYVDQNGQLLKRVDMACYGTTTIYANGSNAGPNYTLISANAVTVYIRNGVASPASVTFRYQYAAAPTAAPSTVTVPVYYMTETGAMLYQTTATLTRGVTSYVNANTNLVPSYYQLTSAPAVTVAVNAYGSANPASVIFTFRNVTPTPVPETKQAQIPVRYVNENGFLLNETTVTIGYGQSAPVYVAAGMVEQNYRLISQNPVNVTVNANGTAVPAVVIFTFTYQAPTAVPTAIPTAVPTALPTMIPTPVPTQEPTAVPTMIPTPVPTEVPTQAPTEVPTEVPTQVPTAVPTEAPTEIPTQAPTAVPTEAPTEVPTQVPTAVPTEAPTEIPTEVPTEAPTEAPTAAPQPQPQLQAYGSSVGLDGDSYSLTWYIDKNGTPFVSLSQLANILHWGFTRQGECTILDCIVYISFDDSGVQALTVDNASQAANALVWNGDLYVNTHFLRSLGLTVNAQNDWIMMETN